METETRDAQGNGDLGHESHKHHHRTEIIVNGRPHAVPGHRVTYWEAVELAFPGPHGEPNVIFTVTYRHAAQDPSSGELGPGSSVRVHNGTIFNVTRTVKA